MIRTSLGSPITRVRTDRVCRRLFSTGHINVNLKKHKLGAFPVKSNTIVNFVPQGKNVVVERMGKFHKVVDPGVLLAIPGIDKLHMVDIREMCISVDPACAFTSDNVEVHMAGTLFVQFHDPKAAVYGAALPLRAIEELARSVMRTKIGKRHLNDVFERNEGRHGGMGSPSPPV